MLHNGGTTLSNLTGRFDDHNLDNRSCILLENLEGVFLRIQLRSFASFRTSWAALHWRNRCSVSSISVLHKEQIKSICDLPFRRVPLLGSDTSKNHQRYTLNFDIISKFQIQLYSQEEIFFIFNSWVAQISVLVEKSQLHENP